MRNIAIYFIMVSSLLFTTQVIAQNLKKLIGTPLPENVLSIKLHHSNDSTITFNELLESHKGKLIYIDFWASWCKPCRKEMPFSKNMQKLFEGKELVFVYLSTDEVHSDWLDALPKIDIEGSHYRIDIDSKPTIRDYFGINGIPYYILFDREGKILNPKAAWPSDERIIKEIEKNL